MLFERHRAVGYCSPGQGGFAADTAGERVKLNYREVNMSAFPQPCKHCGRVGHAEPLRFSPALFCGPCFLRRFSGHFSGLHLKVLLWFSGVFAALTFLWMLPGAISGHGESLRNGVVASIFAFSGPFTGAISRGHWHWTGSGYGAFGMLVLPYCGTALAVALLFQLLPLRLMKMKIRISIWILGLLGWFAGTLLSVIEANS